MSNIHTNICNEHNQVTIQLEREQHAYRQRLASIDLFHHQHPSLFIFTVRNCLPQPPQTISVGESNCFGCIGAVNLWRSQIWLRPVWGCRDFRQRKDGKRSGIFSRLLGCIHFYFNNNNKRKKKEKDYFFLIRAAFFEYFLTHSKQILEQWWVFVWTLRCSQIPGERQARNFLTQFWS